jgi:hypothetical protein
VNLRTGHDRLLTVAALLAGAAAFLLATSARAQELIERVMAVVAGEVITLGDVTAARDLGLVPPPSGPEPVGEALALLIDRSLMLVEVERYAPPEPDAAAVDREVQRVRMRFASPGALDAVLARAGVDEAYLREFVRQDLRIRAYLDQRFTVAEPEEDELRAYDEAKRAGQPRTDSFEQARDGIRAAFVAERRKALVDTWVAGLRRRAEIVNLYLTSK